MFELEIKISDKILIVAPHPDDECIGTGGVLCKFKNQCDILIMTDGCLGNPKHSKEDERIIRKKQFEDEMDYLVINTFFWIGIEDKCLISNEKCLETIDFSKYSKIILPWYDDFHIDHTMTFKIVMDELKRQKIEDIEIYQYEVHHPMNAPTHYIDITENIEEKMKLIKFHKDQIEQLDYCEISYALAKYRATLDKKYDRYYECYTKMDTGLSSEQNVVIQREKTLEKYRLKNELLINWLNCVKESYISDRLTNEGYKNIVIYGFGDIGRCLFKQLNVLQDVSITIYDKGKRIFLDNSYNNMPEEKVSNVDLVIVTVLMEFESIQKKLKELGYRKIVSLIDLIIGSL